MPALEILLLQLAPGISPTDPSILQNMTNVRSALRQRIYNTNSRCYQCIKDPTLIFIFGIWPDLTAHQAFLDSPLKSEILGLQQDQTRFKWMVHIEVGDMEEMPFEAPIMVIDRLQLKSGRHVIENDRLLMSQKTMLVQRITAHNVVEALRSDSDSGNHELITISGWESVEAHEVFMKSMTGNKEDPASEENRFGEKEVFYARNMER